MQQTFKSRLVKYLFGFIILGILYLSSTVDTYAQIFQGRVVNEQKEILVGAHIQDTVYYSQAISDRNGLFTLKVAQNSVLIVSYIGYKTAVVHVNAAADTVNTEIILEPSINQLREVGINANKERTVIGKKLDNFLDYVPYQDFVLALKSRGKKDYLSLETSSKVLLEFDIDALKAESLFEDCYGNIHILSKDSSYQIWIDTTLQIIAKTSMNQFNEYLKHCVGHWDKKYIFQAFSNHNKRYSLYSINMADSSVAPLLTVWDKDSEKVSSQDYGEIIGYYNMVAPSQTNLIANGLWDGDLIDLLLPGDKNLMRMITWYLKVQSAEIDVYAFPWDKGMLAVDCFNDSIYMFNESNQQIGQVHFQKPEEKLEQVIMDKMNYKLYFQTVKNGVQSLFVIDLVSGKNQRVCRLDGIAYAENIQVFNDYAYFIKAKKSYHELYRVAVDDYTFKSTE